MLICTNKSLSSSAISVGGFPDKAIASSLKQAYQQTGMRRRTPL
ncbi:MAG: hypothetical protein RMY62_002565 [Nostoc sp. ZfuVER08]|nr:hypothetical protein [Nostoc sp. ZfuVER08]